MLWSGTPTHQNKKKNTTSKEISGRGRKEMPFCLLDDLYQVVLTGLMPYDDCTKLNFFLRLKKLLLPSLLLKLFITPISFWLQRPRDAAGVPTALQAQTYDPFCWNMERNVQFPPQKSCCQKNGTASYLCFLCLPTSPTCEESFWLSGAPCLSKHLPHHFGRTAHSSLPWAMHHSWFCDKPWPLVPDQPVGWGSTCLRTPIPVSSDLVQRLSASQSRCIPMCKAPGFQGFVSSLSLDTSDYHSCTRLYITPLHTCWHLTW